MHLKILDVIVCGLTRCGGIAVLGNGVKENYLIGVALALRQRLE